MTNDTDPLAHIEVVKDNEDGRIEEIKIPGVPESTVHLHYDEEDRARIDMMVFNEDGLVIAGGTLDIPHATDLPDEL